MRLATLTLFATVIGLAVGCGKAAPTPTGPGEPVTVPPPRVLPSDRDRLQGVWAVSSFEAGDPAHREPEDELKKLRFVFDGDKFRIVEPAYEEKYSFTLDTASDPKVIVSTALDENDKPRQGFNPNKPQEIVKSESLYKFEGETLVIAVRKGNARPTAFKASPGKERVVPQKIEPGVLFESYEPGHEPVDLYYLKKTTEAIPPPVRKPVGIPIKPNVPPKSFEKH